VRQQFTAGAAESFSNAGFRQKIAWRLALATREKVEMADGKGISVRSMWSDLRSEDQEGQAARP
jgi:hypothetical protein